MIFIYFSSVYIFSTLKSLIDSFLLLIIVRYSNVPYLIPQPAYFSQANSNLPIIFLLGWRPASSLLDSSFSNSQSSFCSEMIWRTEHTQIRVKSHPTFLCVKFTKKDDYILLFSCSIIVLWSSKWPLLKAAFVWLLAICCFSAFSSLFLSCSLICSTTRHKLDIRHRHSEKFN